MSKYIDLVLSSDIRNHLKKINFTPSGLDAALMVEKNYKIPLDEKFELWDEIGIEYALEKEKILVAPRTFLELNLKDILSEYVKSQKKLYKEFFDEENAVYTYNESENFNVSEQEISSDYTLYKSPDLCYNDAKSLSSDSIIVKKRCIKVNPEDKHCKIIKASYTPNDKITQIEEVNILDNVQYGINRLLKSPSTVPLPFKKGDLIFSPRWDLMRYKCMRFEGYSNGWMKIFNDDLNEEFELANELECEKYEIKPYD